MTEFLPVSKAEMISREWWYYDFLLVTGDAYVDHPAFGAAVIGRVLEHAGYRVAVLAQPDWHSAETFSAMGRPRYGVLIGAGNLDSMVAHYTAAKRRRSEDFYSPGKRAGLRPDRAVIVYANRAREAFPDVPVIIGGLEASLRRFSHYDYWDDTVRRSVLTDSGADLLVYGMGETATLEIAAALKKKTPVAEITGIRGTAYLTREPENCPFAAAELPGHDAVASDRRAYARATAVEYAEHDAVRGKALLQKQDLRTLVVNPPQPPLDGSALDAVAELPYTRRAHPMYDPLGGVPALDEVRFSVTHNRGCFGGCCFCSLAFHQGRAVTARTVESCVREVKAMTAEPDWKGYVSDVGGPTANFRHASCAGQQKRGMCADRGCLFPEPCPNLNADETDYLELLRALRAVDGVKKVFVRSGIRYDYLLEDRKSPFFSELVKYHVSGQLRVAPEHCADRVLACMGKPGIGVWEQFMDRYRRLNEKNGTAQYAVPYLMSSHPGSTLTEAVELACWLKRHGIRPEQVQDFYPTPGTVSTCMYYTGIDPRSGKAVYVPKTPEEKAMQRALLQWWRPEVRKTVREALRKADRDDLIGYGKDCLVPPERTSAEKKTPAAAKPKAEAPVKKEKPAYKKGWARPKAKPKPGKKKK